MSKPSRPPRSTMRRELPPEADGATLVAPFVGAAPPPAAPPPTKRKERTTLSISREMLGDIEALKTRYRTLTGKNISSEELIRQALRTLQDWSDPQLRGI